MQLQDRRKRLNRLQRKLDVENDALVEGDLPDLPGSQDVKPAEDNDAGGDDLGGDDLGGDDLGGDDLGGDDLGGDDLGGDDLGGDDLDKMSEEDGPDDEATDGDGGGDDLDEMSEEDGPDNGDDLGGDNMGGDDTGGDNMGGDGTGGDDNMGGDDTGGDDLSALSPEEPVVSVEPSGGDLGPLPTPERPSSPQRGLPERAVNRMIALLRRAANHRRNAEQELLKVGSVLAKNGFVGHDTPPMTQPTPVMQANYNKLRAQGWPVVPRHRNYRRLREERRAFLRKRNHGTPKRIGGTPFFTT